MKSCHWRVSTGFIGLAMAVAACATVEPLLVPQGVNLSSPPPLGKMSLYRPKGTGPSPAVVLLHTCGGLGQHVFDWASRLTSAGYVSVVIDSFTPRGAGYVCGNWAVTADQVADDALAALAHLRSLPFVDGKRVAVMGFSYGAMAGLKLASRSYVSQRGMPGFQSVVAFYPYCSERYFYDDISTPTLILIGDADDETPALMCTDKAKVLQGKGQPVFFKVYPGTTHAFDTFRTQPFVNTYGGRSHIYRYDPVATADAEKEAKAFLVRHLGPAR